MCSVQQAQQACEMAGPKALQFLSSCSKSSTQIPIGYGYYLGTHIFHAGEKMPLTHPILIQGCWNPEADSL